MTNQPMQPTFLQEKNSLTHDPMKLFCHTGCQSRSSIIDPKCQNKKITNYYNQLHSFQHLKMMEKDTLLPSEFPKIVSGAGECHSCKQKDAIYDQRTKQIGSGIFSW